MQYVIWNKHRTYTVTESPTWPEISADHVRHDGMAPTLGATRPHGLITLTRCRPRPAQRRREGQVRDVSGGLRRNRRA